MRRLFVHRFMLSGLIASFTVAVAGIQTPLLAQGPNPSTQRPQGLVIKVGEIRVEGRIKSIDLAQKQLVLDVSSFTLPNGKTSQLTTPKPKTVVIDDHSSMHVRGDAQQKLKATDLKDVANGIFAIIIGKDLGSGKSLPAREMAVWDRVESGVFRFKDSKIPAAKESVNKEPTVNPQEATVKPAVNANPVQSAKSAQALLVIAENREDNRFPIGDFEKKDNRGNPLGWAIRDTNRIKVVEENGNRFLRLSNETVGASVSISTRFNLDPDWKSILVQGRVRATDVFAGGLPQNGVRISYAFQDENGEKLSNLTPASLPVRESSDWSLIKVQSAVPSKAASMRLMLSMDVTTGTADFDDIQLLDNVFIEDDPSVPSLPIRKGLPEGTFEQLDAQGNPVGWKPNDPKRVQFIEENGNRFLRLISEEPNFISTTSRFRLDPSWVKVKIWAKVRGKNIKPGKQNHESARLAAMMEDATGTRVGPWQPAIEVRQDMDWTEMQVEMSIPEGAVFIKLSPEMISTTGIIDYDDIRIEPGRPG